MHVPRKEIGSRRIRKSPCELSPDNQLMAPRPRHAGIASPAQGFSLGGTRRALCSLRLWGSWPVREGEGGGARVYGRVHKYLFIHKQTNKKSQAQTHTLLPPSFSSLPAHTQNKNVPRKCCDSNVAKPAAAIGANHSHYFLESFHSHLKDLCIAFLAYAMGFGRHATPFPSPSSTHAAASASVP